VNDERIRLAFEMESLPEVKYPEIPVGTGGVLDPLRLPRVFQQVRIDPWAGFRAQDDGCESRGGQQNCLL
jgi:hypothetical protein